MVVVVVVVVAAAAVVVVVVVVAVVVAVAVHDFDPAIVDVTPHIRDLLRWVTNHLLRGVILKVCILLIYIYSFWLVVFPYIEIIIPLDY